MTRYKQPLFKLRKRITRIPPGKRITALAAVSLVDITPGQPSSSTSVVLPVREGLVDIRRDTDGEHYSVSLQGSYDFQFGLCRLCWKVENNPNNHQGRTQKRYISTFYNASWGSFQVRLSPLEY